MLHLFVILAALSSIAWTEDFSSRTEAENNWRGDWEHLTINAYEQLQNQMDQSGECYLLRPSQASIQAEWTFYTRIYGGSSAYNLTRLYILAADSITADSYYVQIGGANKNITLCQLRNGTSRKVIEHADRKNILPLDAQVYVQLTRDEDGRFHLFSLIENIDTEFVEEGSYNVDWLQAQSLALFFKNSSQRGHDMFFDDIQVQGEPQLSPISPQNDDVQLSISGDCLSLHQQGYQDHITISYRCPADTYKGNMHVYSADGRLIRTCCQQTLLESSGTMLWNGKDNHDNPVEIGIYVIIIELTSSAHAPVRKRYPIAVIH